MRFTFAICALLAIAEAKRGGKKKGGKGKGGKRGRWRQSLEEKCAEDGVEDKRWAYKCCESSVETKPAFCSTLVHPFESKCAALDFNDLSDYENRWVYKCCDEKWDSPSGCDTYVQPLPDKCATVWDSCTDTTATLACEFGISAATAAKDGCFQECAADDPDVTETAATITCDISNAKKWQIWGQLQRCPTTGKTA